MHTVTRVYNNGDMVKVQFHSIAEMDAHLDYSVKARFGCAHFRDGKCVSLGYLGLARCVQIEASLQRNTTQQPTQHPDSSPLQPPPEAPAEPAVSSDGAAGQDGGEALP